MPPSLKAAQKFFQCIANAKLPAYQKQIIIREIPTKVKLIRSKFKI